METITIINKSGKVVSTGKHLVNIFKDAREAYNEKKSSLKSEHRQRIEFKQAQKLLEGRGKHDDGTQSVASSHRSRRSHRHRDENGVSRPPLTERNLSNISEGSVTSSRRSRSHHGSRRGSRDIGSGGSRYRSPYIEDAAAGPSQRNLTRRHTEFPSSNHRQSTELSRAPSTLPPPYTRSASNPDFHAHSRTRSSEDYIDMNLAYGAPPLDLLLAREQAASPQQAAELKATMSKLDTLLLEAHCVQHSATAIIKNLQDNPEAMAAVALTLAELSNILTKMSPAILATLKTSSPAVFALLASPQFLIAGGLALGVTVVMFGGYKIVKKIQADNAAKKEANRMEEALVWDPSNEMSSIESWRRGITPVDGDGGTSVEGEIITPEAARQQKERIKERRREERSSGWRGRGSSSVAESVRSERTIRRIGSDETIRRKDLPMRTSSKISLNPESESGRSRRDKDKGKGKEVVSVKEKEKKEKKDKKEKEKSSSSKGSSALSVIFHKSKKGKSNKDGSEVSSSHHPRLVEL